MRLSISLWISRVLMVTMLQRSILIDKEKLSKRNQPHVWISLLSNVNLVCPFFNALAVLSLF